MNAFPQMLTDLRAHQVICRELLGLAERESQALRQSQNAVLHEVYQAKKTLLPRLNESLEKVRVASSKVLGKSVRVCARIENVAGSIAPQAANTQELRAQFERDPMVKSMLQRFGRKISEVKRPVN